MHRQIADLSQVTQDTAAQHIFRCVDVQITKLAVEDGGGLTCSAADAVMSLL
jgi:hypothetical protein